MFAVRCLSCVVCCRCLLLVVGRRCLVCVVVVGCLLLLLFVVVWCCWRCVFLFVAGKCVAVARRCVLFAVVHGWSVCVVCCSSLLCVVV